MKILCEGCRWVGDSENLLSAANPFEAIGVVFACPECKRICDLVPACDEKGCPQRADCGFPTPAGYRKTCHEHKK